MGAGHFLSWAHGSSYDSIHIRGERSITLITVYAPLGMLGYGFPMRSLKAALEHGFDVIALDAGSVDRALLSGDGEKLYIADDGQTGSETDRRGRTNGTCSDFDWDGVRFGSHTSSGLGHADTG